MKLDQMLINLLYLLGITIVIALITIIVFSVIKSLIETSNKNE